MRYIIIWHVLNRTEISLKWLEILNLLDKLTTGSPSSRGNNGGSNPRPSLRHQNQSQKRRRRRKRLKNESRRSVLGPSDLQRSGDKGKVGSSFVCKSMLIGSNYLIIFKFSEFICDVYVVKIEKIQYFFKLPWNMHKIIIFSCNFCILGCSMRKMMHFAERYRFYRLSDH